MGSSRDHLWITCDHLGSMGPFELISDHLVVWNHLRSSRSSLKFLGAMWDHLATPEAFWENLGRVSGTSLSEAARVSLGGASEALGVRNGPWDSSKLAEVNMQCIRTKRKNSIPFAHLQHNRQGPRLNTRSSLYKTHVIGSVENASIV